MGFWGKFWNLDDVLCQEPNVFLKSIDTVTKNNGTVGILVGTAAGLLCYDFMSDYLMLQNSINALSASIHEMVAPLAPESKLTLDSSIAKTISACYGVLMGSVASYSLKKIRQKRISRFFGKERFSISTLVKGALAVGCLWIGYKTHQAVTIDESVIQPKLLELRDAGYFFQGKETKFISVDVQDELQEYKTTPEKDSVLGEQLLQLADKSNEAVAMFQQGSVYLATGVTAALWAALSLGLTVTSSSFFRPRKFMLGVSAMDIAEPIPRKMKLVYGALAPSAVKIVFERIDDAQYRKTSAKMLAVLQQDPSLKDIWQLAKYLRSSPEQIMVEEMLFRHLALKPDEAKGMSPLAMNRDMMALYYDWIMHRYDNAVMLLNFSALCRKEHPLVADALIKHLRESPVLKTLLPLYDASAEDAFSIDNYFLNLHPVAVFQGTEKQVTVYQDEHVFAVHKKAERDFFEDFLLARRVHQQLLQQPSIASEFPLVYEDRQSVEFMVRGERLETVLQQHNQRDILEELYESIALYHKTLLPLAEHEGIIAQYHQQSHRITIPRKKLTDFLEKRAVSRLGRNELSIPLIEAYAPFDDASSPVLNHGDISETNVFCSPYQYIFTDARLVIANPLYDYAKAALLTDISPFESSSMIPLPVSDEEKRIWTVAVALCEAGSALAHQKGSDAVQKHLNAARVLVADTSLENITLAYLERL